MAYVKWVANADRHNDWTSELHEADGTVIKMGVPVDLKADVQKSLEAQGRIFETSSKDEFEEHYTSAEVIQPPGNDVIGTAPVFANASSNQNTVVTVEQEPETPVTPTPTPKPKAS